MKKIVLSVLVNVAALSSLYALEMDVPEDLSESVYARSVPDRKPLLKVPKMHPDNALVRKRDLSEYDTPEEKIIRQSLHGLPEKNRPKNIDDALRLMADGKKVLDFVSQGHFFDAIQMNITQNGNLMLAEQHTQQVLTAAFNMSDEVFWEMIKQDPVMAKSIAKHNIPFTLQSLQSQEFNMYFRVTYIRKHIQDPALLEKYQQAYQKSVVQLQWHLFAKSILQDHAFTSGMITFKDPQSRLFNFIDGFAELMSPKYKFHKAIGVHSLWADHAYTRVSSHWNGQKAFGGKNFGIDIKGIDGKPMSILPGNKSHILFGMRANGMTFIKWEEYGTTFNIKTGDYSVLHHTVRYFEKKDVEDDPKLERREVVPGDVLEQFKSLYVKPLTAEEKALIEKDGISIMLQMLDRQSLKSAAAFQKFLIHDHGYQADTLSCRKGGEVILNLSTVKPAPKVVDADDINPNDL